MGKLMRTGALGIGKYVLRKKPGLLQVGSIKVGSIKVGSIN